MHKSGQEQHPPGGAHPPPGGGPPPLLRVTPAWVYAETRRHRIPHIRLGRYVRYRSEAIFLWMDELEGRSSAVPGRESSRSYPVDGASRRPI
jgi:hypothetical protein